MPGSLHSPAVASQGSERCWEEAAEAFALPMVLAASAWSSVGKAWQYIRLHQFSVCLHWYVFQIAVSNTWTRLGTSLLNTPGVSLPDQ